MARKPKYDRKQQRATLRALDAARADLAAAPDDWALRARYHAAIRDYWACHDVRNSRRAGIQVTE
jgi:hypothetical protein